MFDKEAIVENVVIGLRMVIVVDRMMVAGKWMSPLVDKVIM